METIYLTGSEAVQNAGSSMRSAAERMNQVAGNIEASLFRHQQFLDDWLYRYQNLLETNDKKRL